MKFFFPSLFVWTFISFIILIILLRLFVWKRLMEAINKRESTIKEALSEAEKNHQEALKLLEEYQEKLAKSEEEALKIIANGQKTAEEVKKDILEKAKQEGDKLIKRAQIEIKREKESALSELQAKIAELTTISLTKIVERSFREEEQKKILDKSISEIREV